MKQIGLLTLDNFIFFNYILTASGAISGLRKKLYRPNHNKSQSYLPLK